MFLFCFLLFGRLRRTLLAFASKETMKVPAELGQLLPVLMSGVYFYLFFCFCFTNFRIAGFFLYQLES